MPVIVWFRKDLRLQDNPALWHAAESGDTLIPLYILEEDETNPWSLGGASRWWLHHSLLSLSNSIQQLGGSLILRRGRPEDVLRRVIEETQASSIYWNRCYEPHARARDARIKEIFGSHSISVKSFKGQLLFEPWEIKPASSDFYKVFTPFWKACSAHLGQVAAPLTQGDYNFYEGSVKSDSLTALNLLPEKNWASHFDALWTPGEQGARASLKAFVEDGLKNYAKNRDIPGITGTSRLSPHLQFGEVSPRQITHALKPLLESSKDADLAYNAQKYFNEIGWREFSYHLLFHFPELPHTTFQKKFEHFEWSQDKALHLKSWQRGMTGYPIVDAGMRELWHTGWMHNRIRMVVASFLTKHLLIPWQDGEAWFWDTLVDADLANNAASWQWVSGCGADAAPYFRIFNPILQGEKFDPDGVYVRKWIPELHKLPNTYLHQPWLAPKDVLTNAGISLGSTYPYPIVDHKVARDRALSLYKKLS